MAKHVAPKDDLTLPANTGPLARMRKKRAAAAATGALMIVAPAAVSVPTHRADVSEETVTRERAELTADSKAVVVFARSEVKTSPAPEPPAPNAAPVVEAPVPPPTPRPVATVAPTPTPVPARPAVPAVPPPTVAVGKAAGIIAAAWAQIGRFQDCTALVTNALAAVGVRFHGWPAGYLGLGHIVPASAAIPGDVIYYANGGMGLAHIAVYAGQGLAIHGGWNGNQTVSFSANVGSGPVFIRIH